MEYLVGVGVAYPAEKARVGERPLKGVILLNQPLSEFHQIRLEDFESSSPELLERLFTAHQPEGRTPLRARLGKNQRAIREIECGQTNFPGHFPSGGDPAEPPGNHEMDYEKEILFELHDDALPHSPHTKHALSIRRADRRID